MNDHHQDTRNRSDSSEVAFRKIFIGGLSYSTDEDKLKKYFKVYGSVQDAVVMKDPVSKRSRGFGFITFYDVNSVDNALANEPHTIDSRKVEAKRAVPRSEIARDLGGGSLSGKSGNSSQNTSYNSTPNASPQISSYKSLAGSNSISSGSNNHSSNSVASSYNQLFDSRHAVDPKINMEEYAYNKIFVGGLHYDTRDAEFRHYFERYGKVVSAEVMFNRETHKSRGFGFIVFELEQGAVKVCAEKEHIIDGKVVEVKRAIPRSRLSLSVAPIPSSPGGTIPNKTISTSPGSQSAPNIRQDVRRAMSIDRAQGSMSDDMSASSAGGPYNLLGGTGSLTQQQQQKLSTMMPPLTSNSSLSNAIRKPYNAAVASGSVSRAVGGSTYASALKLGNTTFGDVGGGETSTSADLLVGSSTTSLLSGSKSGSGGTSEFGSSLGGNIDLQSLLYSSSLGAGSDLGVRPFRSYSEPIVKFDNSSLLGMSGGPGSCASLNGDLLLPFDNAYGRTSAISRSSNNSSRSSSILLHDNSAKSDSRRQSFDQVGHQTQQQGYSLGRSASGGEGAFNSLANISWLSSPSILGLDGNTSLDNSGLFSTASSRHNSLSGLQLPSTTTFHSSGSKNSFTGSASVDGRAGSTGALTPGTTIESLFGLSSSVSTPISPMQQHFGGLNLSGSAPSTGGSYQNMTSLQALQQHQQQQAQFQHQQQQQMLSSHQQLHGGPSLDTWASMVTSHQMQEEQHGGQMQQQQSRFAPQYGDQQKQQQHQQQQSFYQQPPPPAPQSAFYPSPQQQHLQFHQQQQMMFQQQQHQQQARQQEQQQEQQQFHQNASLFGGSPQSLYSSPGHLPASSQQQHQSLNGRSVSLPSAFPQFQSGGGLDLGFSSLGTERDELVVSSDLRLDSQEFDPKAPWLYANKL